MNLKVLFLCQLLNSNSIYKHVIGEEESKSFCDSSCILTVFVNMIGADESQTSCFCGIFVFLPYVETCDW